MDTLTHVRPDELVKWLGLANVLLILALIAQGVWGAWRGLVAARKISKLTAEREGLSNVLNATHNEYTSFRRRVTQAPSARPLPVAPPSLPPPPVFHVPPPLDLTPPEGDDGQSWEEDAHKTQFRDAPDLPLTTTQRVAVNPILLEGSKPPESESGARPLPTGAKKTGRT